MSGKKNTRARLRVPIHMKRIHAQLKLVMPAPPEGQPPVEPITGHARVLLNDLSTRGIGLFTSLRLQPDQLIELTFDEPVKAVLKAKTVWCHEHHLGSHVISPTPYSFRAGALLQPATPEEEAQTKALFEEFTKEFYKQ